MILLLIYVVFCKKKKRGRGREREAEMQLHLKMESFFLFPTLPSRWLTVASSWLRCGCDFYHDKVTIRLSFFSFFFYNSLEQSLLIRKEWELNHPPNPPITCCVCVWECPGMMVFSSVICQHKLTRVLSTTNARHRDVPLGSASPWLMHETLSCPTPSHRANCSRLTATSCFF